MWQGLTGVHLIVIVFLVVLLFGAPKLPMLAKSLGQSMKILKREISDSEGTTPEAAATAANPAANSAAQPVVNPATNTPVNPPATPAVNPVATERE